MNILVNGKKYNRKPLLPVRNLGIIFLDGGLCSIYQAQFLVNKKIVQGISLDKKHWIVSEKKGDLFIIDKLFLETKFTEQEKRLISLSGIFCISSEGTRN